MTPYVIVLAVLILAFVYFYNILVSSRNRVNEAWSDIDVQLKRRHDLIPNVLETVKGYAAHEKGVLEGVTRARTAALSAKTAKEHAKAEDVLSNTLKTLFAVSENYPELKANANFLDLQRELADTENKIQAARRFYNSTVLEYNTRLQVIPTNVLARAFRFGPRDFFELVGEHERENVAVKF